jgi:DNA-binding FadR family transcriptional regulator
VLPFVRPASSQRDAVLAAIRAELAAGRAFPSQRALCAAYGVPRSTMSDWLGAWEAAGQVPPRRITGRTKRLASG